MLFYPETDEIARAFAEANFDQNDEEMYREFYNWLADKWDAAYNCGKYDQQHGVQQTNPYRITG